MSREKREKLRCTGAGICRSGIAQRLSNNQYVVYILLLICPNSFPVDAKALTTDSTWEVGDIDI